MGAEVHVEVIAEGGVVHTEQWQVHTREEAMAKFEVLLAQWMTPTVTPIHIRLAFVRRAPGA